MFSVKYIDCVEPSELIVEVVPNNFKELMTKLLDKYPSRIEKVLKYDKTILKNNKPVKSLNETIDKEDEIVIILSLVGG